MKKPNPNSSAFRTFVKTTLILIAITAITVPIATYSRFRTEADHVLAESKNAELALRLLAIEYYGRDEKIYDALRPDGLAEGAAEEVRALSGAQGELILGTWDAARSAASSFTYTTGKFVVMYQYDKKLENHWKVYYQFRDVRIPDWQIKGRE